MLRAAPCAPHTNTRAPSEPLGCHTVRNQMDQCHTTATPRHNTATSCQLKRLKIKIPQNTLHCHNLTSPRWPAACRNSPHLPRTCHNGACHDGATPRLATSATPCHERHTLPRAPHLDTSATTHRDVAPCHDGATPCLNGATPCHDGATTTLHLATTTPATPCHNSATSCHDSASTPPHLGTPTSEMFRNLVTLTLQTRCGE